MRNLKGVVTAEEFANKKLSEMTFEEVLRFQNARDNKNKGTNAVGKYQFMKRTLFGANMKGGLVDQAGLTMSDKFSPENQEKLQQVFLGQNAEILKKSGVPTTPGYLYMAHYIGPYGAIAVFKASEKGEDVTVAQALVNKGYSDPSKHNPELAKIRVSQLEQILSDRMTKNGAAESVVEAVPEPKKEMPQIAAAVSPEEPEGTPEAQASSSSSGQSLSSVFDAQPGVDTSKLHPAFIKAAIAMANDFTQKTGKKLLITSGYRDNAKQKKLFDAKVAELGGDTQSARKWVAEPMPPLGKGRGSFHMKGLALDINTKGAHGLNALAGSRSKSTGWLESFGLTRPVPGEDWHVQPLSTPPTPDNPLSPGAPIQVADKDANAINLATGEKKSKPSATKVAAAVETGASIGKTSMEAKVEPSMRIAKKAPAVQPIVTTGAKSSVASAQTKVNADAVLAEYRLMLGTA
jgi:LAS superfamily LD-carboxypeptidase LdcB